LFSLFSLLELWLLCTVSDRVFISFLTFFCSSKILFSHHFRSLLSPGGHVGEACAPEVIVGVIIAPVGVVVTEVISGDVVTGDVVTGVVTGDVVTGDVVTGVVVTMPVLRPVITGVVAGGGTGVVIVLVNPDGSPTPQIGPDTSDPDAAIPI